MPMTASASQAPRSAPQAVQLLPAGAFRSTDGSGRPDDTGGKPWFIDGVIAQRVIARAAARANRLVIDYEHQTLLAEKNGQPAPAAGWWQAMAWREPDAAGQGGGLWATDVQWTTRAAQSIGADEYKYISAVFAYDKATGEVLELRLAALTNTPGIDGMEPVAALRAALGALSSPSHTGDPAMDLKKLLLAALGLPDTTTDEALTTAVAALKASAAQAGTEVAALKAAAAAAPSGVDPAKFVPIETYQAAVGQIAALTAQHTESPDALIAAAEKEHKVLPSEKAWLADMAQKSGIAALKAHLSARQPMVVLAGMQSQAALTAQHAAGAAGGGAGAAAGALSTEALAVCKAMGLTPEQYAKGQLLG